LLAQHGEAHQDVVALRARIKRLQTKAVLPVSHAVGNRAEARAQAARALGLESEKSALDARIARLEQALLSVGPLSAARDRAEAKVREVEARRSVLDASQASHATVAEVASRGQAMSVERRGLRVLVSVLTPLGAAILGSRVGDIVEWQSRRGPRRVRVEQILFQPEAAGDFHL
jgi:transcription elongation GreA/GreB family factor